MTGRTKRVDSLDAFRGVTSILIMITHYLLYIPQVCQVENLGYVYSAFSWKLPYFFVLSGFVLTLSYRRCTERSVHPYREFITTRFLRLYPLFFITTVAAYVIRLVFNAGTPLDGASIFFNIPWKLEDSFVEFLHALTLIGNANTWMFNGPAWTLVFEFRFAILFPLLLAMLRWRSYSYALFIALAFGADYISSGLESVDIFYSPNYTVSNLCSMFHFLLPYAAGILFALHREKALSFYSSLSRGGRHLHHAICVLLVITPVWARGVVPPSIYSVVSTLLIIIGVVMWMTILIENRSFRKLFSHPVLVKIGRSSFSIYLWHIPIFTLLYMLLGDRVEIVWIIPLSIAVTLSVAQLSFKYIESLFISIALKRR